MPDSTVPQGLRTVADWSWRLLVILALVAAAVAVVVRLEVLFVALFVALLLSALLEPPTRRLRAAGVPRALATAGVLVGALLVIGGVLFLAGRSLVEQADELVAAVTTGVDQVRAWVESRLGMSSEQLGDALASALKGVGGGGAGIGSSVFGAASTAAEVVGGAGIALFATIFFVHDGAGIWAWATSLFPRSARGHVAEAGRLSWQTLSSYARGTVVIAGIDAVGIGVGAAIIGVPLAGPIGILVFFASFVPIVGALVSGLVAVLIALATLGVTGALLMAVIVLAVQQLEGHVLQPMIQGRFVAIHPLAVVLAVGGGSIVAGIVGAVIAVPIVAVANVLVRYAVSAGGPDASTGDVPGADPAADPGPVTSATGRMEEMP